ncbi:MAG: indole-3-glycerol phosphate synthase TrpC [Candidatus Omnitrophica bacterium]|nr:indole-3-glycerol phosphate synthase TrpC [Candidatus Omnitrophota bacterium]
MMLNDIVLNKRKEIKKAKHDVTLKSLIKEIKPVKQRHAFKTAIQGKDKLSLIAEIKKKSPSKGVICSNFNPVKIAIAYEKFGASAISVLTDKKYFGGDLKYLREIRTKVALPLLRKDFLIDEYQMYESLFAGADAVLLIARILDQELLKQFLAIAKRYGIDALVEVHDVKDLEKAINAGAEIIGINNRDLGTFKVSLKRTEDLARFIPHDKIVVSESGIKNRKDALFVKKLGAHAVLVGETLMKSNDVEQNIKELIA